MPGSKIHRYLVRLIAGGLIEQDEERGRYRPGPFAMTVIGSHGRIDRSTESATAQRLHEVLTELSVAASASPPRRTLAECCKKTSVG